MDIAPSSGKEGDMNRHILEGKWKQLKGSVKEKWGELTDDELDKSAGRFDKVAGLLQERYGYAKDQAEQELEEFLEETGTDFADESRPGAPPRRR
jgi:uncharacterized protein YjbJ (UPF0337 family)